MTKQHAWIGLLAGAVACATPDTAATDGGGDAAPFTKGVSTLAGTAQTGNIDGDRSVALFSNPVNVLLARDATLYVADFDNGLIRTVDSVGNVSTLIQQTGFVRPFGLAQSADGTLYVETDNDPHGAHSTTTGTVWRIDIAARTATVIAANLGRPRGLAVLADGRIAMADDLHHVVQLLDPSTGTVEPLAGTFDAPGYVDAVGAAARFSQPYGIAVRADGKLVVADFDNRRLRLVDLAAGATTTFAGNGTAGFVDGTLATAELDGPQGVAIDTAGDIYITDSGNYRVRRIRGNVVDTVAGNGTAGYVDADDRLAAELYGLEGITVSGDGATLIVADGNRGIDAPYNRVRLVKMAP